MCLCRLRLHEAIPSGRDHAVLCIVPPMIKLIFTLPLVRLDPCHLMVEGVTVGGIFQRLYRGTGGENKKGAASTDVSRRP